MERAAGRFCCRAKLVWRMSAVREQGSVRHALLSWRGAGFAPQGTQGTEGKGVQSLVVTAQHISPHLPQQKKKKRRKQNICQVHGTRGVTEQAAGAARRWQRFLPHLCNLSQTFPKKGRREGGEKKGENKKRKKQNQLAAYTRHPERYCRDSNVSIQCSRACSCVNSFHMSSLQ